MKKSNDESIMKVVKKKFGCWMENGRFIFRIWAPDWDSVHLSIYDHPFDLCRTLHPMIQHEDQTFEITLDDPLDGKYYTYLLENQYEITDPFSRAVSVNSQRSAIVSLKETNPKGWWEQNRPRLEDPVDAIVYEMHVKDFTIDHSSGVALRGKYLGAAEKGTTHNEVATGLDHLKELGITHIHLMPVFDFLTVDEEEHLFFKEDNYNWGYDPEHYNVPEGSYASRPSDPKNRIKELKTLIMILHNEGFQVIMDVVYNHTYRGKTSHLNLLASDYYYRLREDGSFSDGAGCGNELATEKEMVRKMIIDSLVYWMEEYKVDGFRFDLMALIDIETISKAVQVLRMIKKDVLIYGEPWTADQTVLKDECMTRKGKQQKRSFAFFNDEYRDAIKGDSDGIKGGFVQGEGFLKKEVEKGIAGSIYYDDERIGFTATPQETVNYVNSHDNLILYDKMAKMFPHQDGFIERINKMAFFLLFVSQGIPFIHAGNEFLRSKSMVENSYRSGIEINKVNWEDKLRHYHFFVFFKELIALRKAFPEFRLRSAEEIRSRLLFLHFNPNDDRLLGFVLRKTDDKGHLLVLVNAKDTPEIIPTQNIRKELKSHEEVIGEKCYYQLVFDVEGMKEKEYHPDQCYSHALKVAAFGFSVYLIHESDETRWE